MSKQEIGEIFLLLFCTYSLCRLWIYRDVIKDVYSWIRDVIKRSQEFNHNINQLEQVMGYGKKSISFPPLDEADVLKISLYIPFKVTFGLITMPEFTDRHIVPAGIMGNRLIKHTDQVIFPDECPDLTAPNYDMRPILRRLKYMTDKNVRDLQKLTHHYSERNERITAESMADHIFSYGYDDEVFMYCLKEHLDIFELIFHDKAIDVHYAK